MSEPSDEIIESLAREYAERRATEFWSRAAVAGYVKENGCTGEAYWRWDRLPADIKHEYRLQARLAYLVAADHVRAAEREWCANIADLEEESARSLRDERPKDSYHWSFWERARKTAAGIAGAIRETSLERKEVAQNRKNFSGGTPIEQARGTSHDQAERDRG